MKTTKKSAAKKPKTTRGAKSTQKPARTTKAAPAKGRTATHDATAAKKKAPAKTGADAYQSPTIDRPPRGDDEGKRRGALKTEPLDIDWGTTEGPEAKTIPGEAINGVHLARCIRFAVKVAPKKGGTIVFTHTAQGTALVSGHDQRRVHTGYLVEGAAMLADIVVPRAEAVKIADALEGLDGPLVRISAAGMVLVHHGTAQPPLHFNIGAAPITQAWEGPSFDGRTPARVPLRIPAAWQSVACRWPDAISQSNQSDDGIEFLSITDAETGTLLARATLAQEGRDLLPEDQRQTEIPGSRTAGVKAAVADLHRVAADMGGTVTVSVSKGATKIVADAPTVGTPSDAVSITSGGVSVDASPTPTADVSPGAPDDASQGTATGWPEAGTRPVVVEVPEALWDGLSPEALVSLHEPLVAGGPKTQWIQGDVGTRSVAVSTAQVHTLTARLSSLGLGLRSARSKVRFDGLDCDHWIAGALS